MPWRQPVCIWKQPRKSHLTYAHWTFAFSFCQILFGVGGSECSEVCCIRKNAHILRRVLQPLITHCVSTFHKKIAHILRRVLQPLITHCVSTLHKKKCSHSATRAAAPDHTLRQHLTQKKCSHSVTRATPDHTLRQHLPQKSAHILRCVLQLLITHCVSTSDIVPTHATHTLHLHSPISYTVYNDLCMTTHTLHQHLQHVAYT